MQAAFRRCQPSAYSVTQTRSLHNVIASPRLAGQRQLLAPAQATAAGVGLEKYILWNGFVDYYTLLGIDDDADTREIKKAYRTLAKECHPDYLGDKGHDVCILLNEAYEILMSDESRQKYNAQLEQALQDEIDDYTGEPLSKWMPSLKPNRAKNEDPHESRAVFVDEFSCIGCKQCIFCAPATFRIEQEYGRSRVYAQWLENEDRIQTAIDSCPVSCIHWVAKDDLAPLEYVMQKRLTQRVNVGVMMAGQGASADVWAATTQFLKERKCKEEARAASKSSYSRAQEEARRRAAEELQQQRGGSFFNNMFNNMFASALGGLNVMGSMVGDEEELKKVGYRKRSAQSRWDWLEKQAAAGGWMVPPERALVPISVYAEMDKY